jgi:hypothetical protein
MSRELFLMASEKVDPGAIVNKSLIEESIANEKTGRVFCYIDRIGHLRMLRNVFEGARSLEDIPKSIKDSVHEIFTGVIVRKVAIIFPSPINPQATSLIDARKNIASIYQYVGALSALRPPTMPIGMTFPFDF